MQEMITFKEYYADDLQIMDFYKKQYLIPRIFINYNTKK